MPSIIIDNRIEFRQFAEFNVRHLFVPPSFPYLLPVIHPCKFMQAVLVVEVRDSFKSIRLARKPSLPVRVACRLETEGLEKVLWQKAELPTLGFQGSSRNSMPVTCTVSDDFNLRWFEQLASQKYLNILLSSDTTVFRIVEVPIGEQIRALMTQFFEEPGEDLTSLKERVYRDRWSRKNDAATELVCRTIRGTVPEQDDVEPKWDEQLDGYLVIP